MYQTTMELRRGAVCNHAVIANPQSEIYWIQQPTCDI
jgi:hypothetical protein